MKAEINGRIVCMNRFKIIKITILPKLIYRFSAVSIKTYMKMQRTKKIQSNFKKEKSIGVITPDFF
jgi:hypothetical protein